MWIRLTLFCLIALCSCENGDKFLGSEKYSKGDSILWYILQKLHHDDKRIDEIQKSVHEIQKNPNLDSANLPDKNKIELNKDFKTIISDIRTNFTLLSIKYESDSNLKQKQLDRIQATQQKETAANKSQDKTILNLEKEIRELKHTINKKHPWIKDGYIGCFKDDANRHLKDKIAYLSQTTLLKCKQHCHGFKYTGLQAGSACTCGNTLINPSYPRVPESECNMQCPNESNRMCGAGYRNSIYRGDWDYTNAEDNYYDSNVLQFEIDIVDLDTTTVYAGCLHFTTPPSEKSHCQSFACLQTTKEV